MVTRRASRTVRIGEVAVGGRSPIAVQSMTDTDTADAAATAAQIVELADAGSEMVRITINNGDAAKAVPEIRRRLSDTGHGAVPLIGDFHFIGHRLLSGNRECADGLDKYRINPGNIGRGERRDDNFRRFIEIARDLGKPVRIGVNAGSLDQALLSEMMDRNARAANPKSAEEVESDALVESAIGSAAAAVDLGLPPDLIVLSCKVSRPAQVVAVNRRIAAQCDYPLHIGLTEAGMGQKGIVSSSGTLAILLNEGIGDTIRVSLTPAVGAKRALEVAICQDVLQALGIRNFKPQVVACPGCGRTTSARFRNMAAAVQEVIDQRHGEWRRRYPGSESLKIAVMGCVVNGPGESRAADIGISLPGSGEAPSIPVFVDGQHSETLKGDDVTERFIQLLERYIARRWGR